MASYADDLQYLTRQTPYREEFPVDEAIKVGLEKQSRYDQGIQRIQASIDEVAGLPVVRDVDRQYLQSKLNSLGSKLKTFVGADYSNFQLTNNVMGMANQIAKDPNIINAVSSGQKYREQVKKMQEDISNGKSNPANNFRFNKRASQWLNSTNLNDSFNTYYQPPIDVWAKIKDVAKEVGIDEQDVQQMYQTDERGEVIRDKKTGEPVWNPIMAEKILKGKDAGKILSAFQSALTPADYEQLAMNGEYEKAHYTPDMLKVELKNSSNEQLDFINNKIKDLKFALYQENQKNDKDQEKLNSLNSQIQYFEKNGQNIMTSLEKAMAQADSNPDAVRASLYTNNYLTRMSKTLSSQDVSTKYSINPKFTVTMELNKFNRQIERDKMEDYKWGKEFELKGKQFELDVRKQELAEQKYKPTTSTGLIGGGIAVEDYASKAKDLYEQQYSDNVRAIYNIDSQISLEYYKKTNKQNPGEDKSAYENRLKRMMYNDANGDLETYTTRIASKQLNDWTINKENVPAEMRGLIESRNNLTQITAEQKANIEDIQKQAREALEQEGISVPTEKELLSKISPITLYLPARNDRESGKSVTLSKDDILNFIKLNPNRFNTFGSITVDNKQREEAEKAEETLKKKYPNDFKEIERKLYNTYTATPGKGELSILEDIFPSGKQYIDQLTNKMGIDVSLSLHPEFKKYAKLYTDPNYEALNKKMSELYIQRGVVNQPTSVAVQRGKEPKEDVISRLANIIGMSNKNEMPGYDKEDMLKVLASNDYISASVGILPSLGNEQAKYTLTLNTKGGQKSMYITPDMYRAASGEIPPVVNTRPVSISKLERRGTTNDTEDGDPSGAFINNSRFSTFKSNDYTITGDYVRDMANPNVTWMKLYVHDKKTGEVIDKLTYPDPNGDFRIFMKNQDNSYNMDLDRYPSMINEAVVKQLMHK